MKWRKGEDYPDKEGKYIVRMSIGSMDRKVEVRESMLTRNGCRPHWQGAFDWNYVIEWLDESPTEIGQQGVEEPPVESWGVVDEVRQLKNMYMELKADYDMLNEKYRESPRQSQPQEVDEAVNLLYSIDRKLFTEQNKTPDWTKEKTYDSEDKEAIAQDNEMRHPNYYPKSTLKEREAVLESVMQKTGAILFNSARDTALEAMDEYAASLLKENEELKEWRDRLIDEKNALISSNEEKEKEIAELKRQLELYETNRYDKDEDYLGHPF